MFGKQEVNAGRLYAPLGAVASRLVEKMKDGKIGDVLTDEELMRVCGQDTRPRGKGYSSLGSAIRYCRKHFRTVWKRQTAANAIKCLADQERAEVVGVGIDQLRRNARRTIEVGVTIDMEKLENGDRSSLAANMAQAGAIKMMATNNTQKKLEARHVADFSKDKLLAAFIEK